MKPECFKMQEANFFSWLMSASGNNINLWLIKLDRGYAQKKSINYYFLFKLYAIDLECPKIIN